MILTENLEHSLNLTSETKHHQENLAMTSFRKILTSLLFFQFTTNLDQFGSRIRKAESVKPIFSLILTFYLTKTENRTTKPVKELSHYCFE